MFFQNFNKNTVFLSRLFQVTDNTTGSVIVLVSKHAKKKKSMVKYQHTKGLQTTTTAILREKWDVTIPRMQYFL